MALSYCDVCGALLRGEAAATAEAGLGAICDPCVTSRRAVLEESGRTGGGHGGQSMDREGATAESSEDSGPPPATTADIVQFNCCYCRALLRLKPVQKRTKIKCPRCNDAFYLSPDGRVEARLEGNTTAVLAPLDATPRPLTPTEGMTPHLGQPPLSKTQPISRTDVAAQLSQQQLLDDLKPKQGKSLDFLSALPERRKDEDLIDTDAYASAGSLELLPTGRASPPPARAPRPQLRPDEEGQVDLDLEGLKRKTQKFGKGPVRAAPAVNEPAPAEAAPAPERPATRRQKKDKDAEPDPEREARREEKERRAAEAATRAAELESEVARRGLSALSLLLIALLPVVVALGLAGMTSRGSGFATRGSFGEGLRDLGVVVDRGVRSFGSTVNPVLPDGWKLPSIEQTRR